MTNKIIQELVEKLSLEFVLMDSSKPGALSELLPILKETEKNSLGTAGESLSEKISEAEKIINNALENRSSDMEKVFADLDNIISQIKTGIHKMINSAPEADKPDSTSNEFEKAEESIEKISELIGQFCPGEIPDLGAMLNACDKMFTTTKFIDSELFHKVALGCKNYLETMTLENIENTHPIEEGVLLLKALLHHIKTGEVFAFDTSDVMELLNNNFDDNKDNRHLGNIKSEELKQKERTDSDSASPSRPMEAGNELKSEAVQKTESLEPEKISDEDMEILADFISEANENLDSIEISLIELEHDPTDNEIINNIFRPFHTIKGVSGFLGLQKINTLSHTTENLLDSARSGNFLINEAATDVILESVDTLKKLISRVEQGLEQGVQAQDNDIDIDALKNKLKNLQVNLSKGSKAPLGEILVDKGIIDDKTLADALKTQIDEPEKKLGEILIRENKARSKDIASALREQGTRKKTIATQVKVSTEKLDNLVDYAGELVIAQSMLRQQASKNPSLQQSIAQFGQIVTSMQNIAMSMRMIPIKATFMKMIRLVRDLSQKSGKKVDLVMTGEETEIDRNVVDALYEPMVHMIRNSVDHGIEPLNERKKNNKQDTGTINLRAYHKGGNILIEIEDDGKGLDRERILEKAISTNLISRDNDLTDSEIYNLILEPGFSTAREITDISGRGVGMDVVKGGIEKLRGQLNINSIPGQGTKFTISLPLTLAIIDGMLVRVGKEKFVIPTIAIKRSFRPEEKNCSTIKGKGEIVKERGDLIPLVRLKNLYNLEDDSRPPWKSLVVVVESKMEQRGLLVDELLGKDEYVIKSLGANLENIDGFAGGAILADGRVGLILDVHGLFKILSQ